MSKNDQENTNPPGDLILLASERAKRAPVGQVFMPDDVERIVGTCIGPGQKPGDPDSRVTVEAPPDGHFAWSLTPAQALDLARRLFNAAKLVEGK